MFITLTALGGRNKIRINTDMIIRYSLNYTGRPAQHSDSSEMATEIILSHGHITYVEETPELIDEIMRISYITVYERM